jgi:hypothetical protein
MRHRIDAILPHGEFVVRTVRQLFGNLSPRKTTLTFVVAGVVGLSPRKTTLTFVVAGVVGLACRS